MQQAASMAAIPCFVDKVHALSVDCAVCLFPERYANQVLPRFASPEHTTEQHKTAQHNNVQQYARNMPVHVPVQNDIVFSHVARLHAHRQQLSSASHTALPLNLSGPDWRDIDCLPRQHLLATCQLVNHLLSNGRVREGARGLLIITNDTLPELTRVLGF
jgi:hypothetical protein